MARRVEAQMSRDWLFGFVSWNYVFRSSINLSRTLYSYEKVSGSEHRSLTASELEDGAISICKALYGKYTDLDGKVKDVRGDMTKIKYVPDLTAAARRLLQNIEHVSRKQPGTQDTRRIMRFDTNAFRVRYCVQIFVTYSPDEAHSLLMVRFSRVRRSDTAFADGTDKLGRKWCGRNVPRLDQDYADDVHLMMTTEEISDLVPDYDERRKLLARDSLASVDGVRLIVALTNEYLL